MSLPVRGAWIETARGKALPDQAASLPVRGAWIETLKTLIMPFGVGCRSPCGERGLKHRRQKWVCNQDSVAPRAGSVD